MEWPVIPNTSGAPGGDMGGLSPFFLYPQPCQPNDCHSLDILDKLILGGLLEEEEVGDIPRPFLGHRRWLRGEVTACCPRSQRVSVGVVT